MSDMIDQFVAQMAEKVGISEEQAKQVVEFIKANAHKLPELVGQDNVDALKDKIPGGLGGLLG